MKKIILAILVIFTIGAMCLGLSACNNATPQGQLANPLMTHSGEHLEYDVALTDAEGKTIQGDLGSYTVDLKLYKAGNVIETFGALSNLKVDRDGVLVTSRLVSDSEQFGNREYQTGCYFSLVTGPASFMTPAYSFRIEKTDGIEKLSVQGSYSGNYYNYDRTADGVKTSGSIKLSGTYFDNNEFQQMLRGVTTFANGLSMSFIIPLVYAGGAEAVTLSTSANGATAKQATTFTDSFVNAENQKVYPDGVDCYTVSLTRNTQVAGVTQTLYYAKDNIQINGWAVKNPLIKFSEPVKADDGKTFNYITYSLKAVTVL